MAKLFRNIFLVFAIVLAFAAVTQAKECHRPNEEFNSCGSACPDRCGETEPRPCTMQCVIGCQCKRGYVLNSEGDCVLPEDC